MMTRFDPWINILRVTLGVFAAGAAGADTITAMPFTLALGLPDEFAGHGFLTPGALLQMLHEKRGRLAGLDEGDEVVFLRLANKRGRNLGTAGVKHLFQYFRRERTLGCRVP